MAIKKKSNGDATARDAAIARVEALCRERGLRFTGLRRRVLRQIVGSRQPLKAYDILRKIGVAATKPPTVYRALDFLLKNNFIHKINSQSTYIGCSHPQESHAACHFLICTDCGEARECCSDELARALSAVSRFNRFQAKNICVEIEGHCGCRGER